MSENNYQLVLQNDTNTNGYSQWFFFKVTNTKKGLISKFNIINMMKKYSLYKRGMKILIYSEKKAEKENLGWHRGGDNIQYYNNLLFKYVRERKRFLYSLTFNYEFEFDNDTVYFANTLPYTYTELMKELNEYQKNDTKYDYFYRKCLCTTLAGNSLDYFTINSELKNVNEKPKNYFYNDIKKCVIIMARVHPGETVGSWMMKGVIDFLTGDSPEAIFLRQNFIFKIIPMMNPDGVVTGNYRTSLAGCDLNRRWILPNEILHPEIYYAKQMINKLANVKKLALIVDLHGHSGTHNIFTYANNIKEEPLLTKFFPFILSKLNPTFNFNQCGFSMPKDKIGTARINLFEELELENIFTVEASFSGCNLKGNFENLHFNQNMLIEMGRDILRGLVSYQYAFEYPNYDFSMIIKNSTLNNLNNLNINNQINQGNVSVNNNVNNVSVSTDITILNNVNISTNGNNNNIHSNQNKKIYLNDKNNLTKELLAALEYQDKLKRERKEVREKSKNINNLETILLNEIESQDESAGSDSEPSVDNFENDLIFKLMPSQSKKKKKKTKKLKTQLFTKLMKTKKEITNNINSVVNSNKKENKSKNEKSPINNPINLNKSINYMKENKNKNLISERIVINNNLNKNEENKNKKEILSQTKEATVISTAQTRKRKKDVETQTEEIFFKYHWSFFLSQNFTVLGAKSLNKNGLTNKTSNIINDIKNSFTNNNFFSKSLSGKKEMSFYGNFNININKDVNPNPCNNIKKELEFQSNKINFFVGSGSGNNRNNIPHNINLLADGNNNKNNIKSPMTNITNPILVNNSISNINPPKNMSVEKHKNYTNLNNSKNLNINVSVENFLNKALGGNGNTILENRQISKGNSLLKSSRK